MSAAKRCRFLQGASPYEVKREPINIRIALEFASYHAMAALRLGDITYRSLYNRKSFIFM
jgi:hypothetical protein